MEHWVSMNWKTVSLWYETLGFERDPEQKSKEGPVEDRKCRCFAQVDLFVLNFSEPSTVAMYCGDGAAARR